MNNKFILSLIVCVIAAGGLGFYAGTAYEKKNAPVPLAGRGPGASGGNFRGGAGGANGAAGGRVGGAGGGFTNGEVVSKDATSLTLKLMDGGSKIVLFSSSTHVGKMADGTTDDLKTGTNVMINGTSNQDGSITASNVQIRPAGDASGFMMRRAPGQGPE